jgi:hypothetical protein
MGLVWTVLMNGLLGLAGYWAARYAFRQPSRLTRGLGAVVLGWSWATLGMEVLGAAGGLTRPNLLAWTGLGLAVALGFRLRGRMLEESVESKPPGAAWTFEPVLAVGLVVWAAVFMGLRSLLQPVKVVSDGPIYHLYFAARWWKEGRLTLIATPFGENAATYFPAVGDLWFTWLMCGWGGDRLAKVGQAPFWVVAALAAYGLARRLGAGLAAAVVATCWFLTTTPLILFSFEPNVDTIFVAGYLLAALFFLEYALGDARGGTLALGALAAGGALATKPTGIVFVPPLLALALGLVARGPGTVRQKLAHAADLAGCPLVMAGFWYGRNAVLTGNPLYPLHLELGGRVLLAGWYGREVMAFSPYYLSVGDWRSLSDILLAVLDPRLALLWVAALAGAWSWRAPRSGRDAWVWGVSALAAANIALYWLAIPYRTQQRFMLHALGLAVVPLARLFDRGRGIRVAALGLLALHLATAENWLFDPQAIPWDLSPRVPSVVGGVLPLPGLAYTPAQGTQTVASQRQTLWVLLIGVLSIGAVRAWTRFSARPSAGRLVPAALATLAMLGGGSALLYPSQLDYRGLFYPSFPEYIAGWLDLETRAGVEGARVAYAGTDLPYYLLGAGLRNEVRYININPHPTWLLHDYHREARRRKTLPTWPDTRPGWDRLEADYEAWLANLRAERIQILVVARANPVEGRHNVFDREGFTIERAWADAHPETFQPLYGVAEKDPEMRIYRVLPPRG